MSLPSPIKDKVKWLASAPATVLLLSWVLTLSGLFGLSPNDFLLGMEESVAVAMSTTYSCYSSSSSSYSSSSPSHGASLKSTSLPPSDTSSMTRIVGPLSFLIFSLRFISFSSYFFFSSCCCKNFLRCSMISEAMFTGLRLSSSFFDLNEPSWFDLLMRSRAPLI